MKLVYTLPAIVAVALLVSCGENEGRRPSFVALPKVSPAYGALVTVGNHPTPEQHGTGERIGFFRTEDGTIWGLPLTLGAGGTLSVCTAPKVHDLPITDTLPADMDAIVGASNEPTGWRGGTGRLELVIRTRDGGLRWLPVRSGETAGDAACWAQEPPGPRQKLHYYRLRAGA